MAGSLQIEVVDEPEDEKDAELEACRTEGVDEIDEEVARLAACIMKV